MTIAISQLEARLKSLDEDVEQLRGSDGGSSIDREMLGKIAMTFDVFAKDIEALKKATRVASADEPAPETVVLDLESTRTVKAIGLEKVAEDDNGELRIVSGVVLEPDVTDAQGDTYNADEIRKTAHLYMLDFQNIGLQHKALINDKAKLVESYTAPVDMEVEGQTVKAGTWIMTVKVFDEDIWNDIKSGALTGFSIGGFAKRIPLNQSDD